MEPQCARYIAKAFGFEAENAAACGNLEKQFATALHENKIDRETVTEELARQQKIHPFRAASSEIGKQDRNSPAVGHMLTNRSVEIRMPKAVVGDPQNVAFDYSTATVVLPRRNIVQRALNRLGRPFGICPFPFAFDSVLEHAGDRAAVFAEIYEKNVWGSAESCSGPGSEIERTERYRNELISLLKRRQIQSIFDAPCGDLNWMSRVLDELAVDYVGGDISDGALESARRCRPGLDVRHFDICTDSFPDAQLWHCRDSLFHLSFSDIWLTLRNASASNIEYALITTNRARLLKNMDIRTGGCRVLDLERPPFSLPEPLEYLADTAGDRFPRFVGLWPVAAISEVVRRASSVG
jgi:hypothetical protein